MSRRVAASKLQTQNSVLWKTLLLNERVTTIERTWEVSSEDLLHPGHHSLADLEVFLGDAVLARCSLNADVQGPQVGSRGRRQRPQLILLLLFLIGKSHLNTHTQKRSIIAKAENSKPPNRDVFLVSLLLDVLVCSLDVLDVHRAQLA